MSFIHDWSILPEPRGHSIQTVPGAEKSGRLGTVDEITKPFVSPGPLLTLLESDMPRWCDSIQAFLLPWLPS